MDNRDELLLRIKATMVEILMLQVTAEEIGDQQPLFGPNSIGLDSVDALQLVIGLKITNQGIARQVLQSVDTMADAIQNGPPANSS